MSYFFPNRHRSNSIKAAASNSSLSKGLTLPATDRVPSTGYPEILTGNGTEGEPFERGDAVSWQTDRNNKDETVGPLGLRSLYQAENSLMDIIFVHGLGGGSIKTWRFGDNNQCFWPQHWLPEEAEFSNTSIHSFGYDSNWRTTRPDVINVHDFGQSLYQVLLTSPLLRHNSKNSPIILVGHSMGGLVIKKAYILAKGDRNHPEIAQRIRCTFFLATPHRGSNSAALLNKVLRYGELTKLSTSKEYVRDLTSNSASTQLINSEFARYAKDLIVFSFYETLPTIKGSSGLIVDKASAILGLYPDNEYVCHLNANHRDICKFRTRKDPNYTAIKNALALAIEDLTRDVSESIERMADKQMRIIEDLLKIQYVPEESCDKVEGSCQWIEDRDDFQAWIGSDQTDGQTRGHISSILWVQAQPGAGKTVLAMHVLSLLSQKHTPCASHFFHFGDQSGQTPANVLKSLALQMANSNEVVRSKLASLHTNRSTFDHEDTRSIWHHIFLKGIFQVAVTSYQFWLIDAVDECVDHVEFITFLKDIPAQYPLKVFLTSRKMTVTPRIIRTLEGRVKVFEIPVNDTKTDIKLYVRDRMADLNVITEGQLEDLIQRILAKSGSSFLWTRLVMEELAEVYTYDSIKEVLDTVPEGMFPYYNRILADMKKRKREQHVTKAILSWVMLAMRPLSVSELSQALQLHIGAQIPDAKAAVESLGGQFVVVESHTGFVQPLHATAREYILSEEAGEFQVVKSDGHHDIAMTCLRLLNGKEMRPPANPRFLLQNMRWISLSVLVDYAVAQVFEHVVRASIFVQNEKLPSALTKLFKTNVLSWVEKVMNSNEPHELFRAARNLKKYLNRRARYHPPIGSHVLAIASWADDLSRILSNFGRALTRSPTSVHFLIPPLCPTSSAIFKNFGGAQNGLTLSGYRPSEWSDCISSIYFEGERAAAVACAGDLVVIAMESGLLHLYQTPTYRKSRLIKVDASVDEIHIDISGSFVALHGLRYVGVWEIDGSLRWKTRIRHRLLLLESSDQYIFGITEHGHSCYWDIWTGDLTHERIHKYDNPASGNDVHKGDIKAPSIAAISPDLRFVALAYRNGPVCIFDGINGTLIAWALDQNKRAPEQLLFNPNPDLDLLLVAYNESHLALYDSSGRLVSSTEAEVPIILNSVTCSQDGRTLATMDARGHLRIWDFESLTLLYHILTPGSTFTILSFTSDGLGLLEVRDHDLKVWSPPALLRKTIEEVASVSGTSSIFPATEGRIDMMHLSKFQSSRISIIVAHPLQPVFFAGNCDGEVIAYDSSHDYQPSTLYTHDGVMIRCLVFGSQDIIVSADLHSNLQARHFSPASPRQNQNILFQTQLDSPITQLLFDTSGTYLLVATLTFDCVYRTKDWARVGIQNFADNREARTWFVVSVPTYLDQFLLLDAGELKKFSVRQFSSAPKAVCEVKRSSTEHRICSITEIQQTCCVIVEAQDIRSRNKLSYVLTLPVVESPEPKARIILLPSDSCIQILGVGSETNRIIFMHPSSFVCSTTLAELEAGHYLEHFHVPQEYNSIETTTVSNNHPAQTVHGDFAFVMHDKVMVITRGLKFEVKRRFDFNE